MKFGQIYFPPQEFISDSEKMRIRLGNYIFNLSFSTNVGNSTLAQQVIQGEGVTIPGYYAVTNSYVYNFEQLFKDAKIVELLNIVTIVYDALKDRSDREALKNFVNKCFLEEGLAYAMNEQGEVKFRPDQEFERNRIVSLKSLTGNEFSAVLEAFNAAFNEFQSDVSKGKSALRYIFEANEILFKKLVKPEFNCTRLTAKNIEMVKDHILDGIMGHLDETRMCAFPLKFLERLNNFFIMQPA